MTKTTQTPRIIRFDGIDDSGEFGAASCPHCGADGRYVHWFLCDDGQRRGAMSGCVKLFPISEIAQEHQKIVQKHRQNNWDKRKLAAIERYYNQDLTEGQCLNWIKDENRKRDDWMSRKGYK